MHHPFPTTILRTAAVLLACTPAFAQWLQRFPATNPSPRWGAGMTFAANSGGLLMFGGVSGLLNGETWRYDGTDWTLLSPVSAPTPRFGHQLVYDEVRQVAVLYGGLASNISIPPPNNDTWEWDGTTWNQVATVANAGARYRYGACYDSLRSRVVMYGGSSTQSLAIPNSQTWEYDGATWTQITTAGNPGPRERPAMCFHQGLGKAVLFGGSNGSGLTNSTWLYDGTAGTWTQLAIAGNLPAARNAATLVYDPVRDLCVLTGGQDANGALADTWTFDGSGWTQQPFATQAVRDHSGAFLPMTGQFVKFGGFVAAPNTLTNSTWEFGSGVFGTGCSGTNGVPTLLASSAPQLGQPHTLTVGNLNPLINVAVFVYGLTRLPGIDLTLLLDMPGCAAFTTPDVLILAVGAAGSASTTWSPVFGAVGDAFYAQALAVDPVNGFGATMSNAIYATIEP